MYIGIFQKKTLEKFIILQRILILIYYILSIRLLYYLLLEFFFGKNNHSWKLQEDNDPKYTSGKAKK